VATIARAKVYPGGRLAMLVLLDPDGRQQTRLGGGAVLHTVFRKASAEIDVFEAAAGADGGERSVALLATFGGAFYSDFLGRGERSFLNPYLGARAGYGYLDGSQFVAQAEGGLELYKQAHAAIDANVRMTVLLDDGDAEAALVFGMGASFAF
jgi:hypothetical protein